jgi:hypothetical protein
MRRWTNTIFYAAAMPMPKALLVLAHLPAVCCPNPTTANSPNVSLLLVS